MNSLYKTLAKTPPLRLSAFSLSSNYCTAKSPSEKPVQAQNQGAVSTEEKHEIDGGDSAKNWPRPSEIVFQSKVANWVNFIGSIRMPVKFVTLPDGKSWAGTVISQDQRFSDLCLLWIPIIFEGDLAHSAATHLKVLDNVHVAGQLSSDPLPINLTNDRVNVQVKVHDIHFVRGYRNMKKKIHK